jgi:hypothetical protein
MAPGEAGSSGGTDPNEARDDERARGKDHQEFNLTEASNKGPDEATPFKITNAG